MCIRDRLKRVRNKDDQSSSSDDNEIVFLAKDKGSKDGVMSQEMDTEDTAKVPGEDIPVGAKASFTFGDFIGYMETNFSTKFGAIEGKVDKVNEKVDNMKSSIASNSSHLQALEARMKKLEGNQSDDEVFTDKSSSTGTQAQSYALALRTSRARANLDERNDRAHDKARRSLLIFPISGDDENEMTANLLDFLANVLGLPHSLANKEGVAFCDIATRDMVIGSSSMLSEMHNKATKRSTAGIRIDSPD